MREGQRLEPVVPRKSRWAELRNLVVRQVQLHHDFQVAKGIAVDRLQGQQLLGYQTKTVLLPPAQGKAVKVTWACLGPGRKFEFERHNLANLALNFDTRTTRLFIRQT